MQQLQQDSLKESIWEHAGELQQLPGDQTCQYISQSMEIESGCPTSLVIYRSEDKAMFMDNVSNYYCSLFLEIRLVDKNLQVE